MGLAWVRGSLFWYSGVAAVLTTALLYGVATVASVDVGNVALLLVLVPTFAASAIYAIASQGIQTASDGAMVGVGSQNLTDFQPDSLPLPNRLGLLFYFVALAALGVASLRYLTT